MKVLLFDFDGVYDASSKESLKEIKATADYYIHDFIELLNMEIKKERDSYDNRSS